MALCVYSGLIYGYRPLNQKKNVFWTIASGSASGWIFPYKTEERRTNAIKICNGLFFSFHLFRFIFLDGLDETCFMAQCWKFMSLYCAFFVWIKVMVLWRVFNAGERRLKSEKWLLKKYNNIRIQYFAYFQLDKRRKTQAVRESCYVYRSYIHIFSMYIHYTYISISIQQQQQQQNIIW